MFIEQLPVPMISKELENEFKIVVEKRLTSNSDIEKVDSEINKMVNELFNLTENELNFIYGASVQ